MSEATTTTCKLCKSDVPEDEMRALPTGDNLKAQQFVLDTIREANPDWVTEDGACSRCWEEYERL